MDAPIIEFGVLGSDAAGVGGEALACVEGGVVRRVRPPASMGPRRQSSGWGAVRNICSLQRVRPLWAKMSG